MKNQRSSNAATVAPANCATQYTPASIGAIRRVDRKPSVIAGLKCPPEMWPRFVTMIPIARPFASATATMSCPLMIPAPPPRKISVNVPTNSATATRSVFPSIPAEARPGIGRN